MTKKKPSPQNRIWEKERRERLNKSFEDLQRLLPDHDPNATLTKIEILQKAIELIGKLQKKIKDLIDECHDPLKEHVHEQDNRLQKLLARNDELIGLLRKAKVTIPPCKYTIEEQNERQHQQTEEKENGKTDGKRRKPAGSKKQSVIKKKPAPTITPSSGPVTDGLALSQLNNVTPPSSGVVSDPSVATSAPCPAIVTSALRNLNGPSVITGGGVSVSVTPALQPAPIMTTSVLITNNGRLLQMPLVTPPASLLIVGNEDVRAKLNLRKRSHSSATGGVKGRPPKMGRFTIKSIDVIPGRIVNGKIPIAPLPRPVKRPIVNEPTTAARVGTTKLQKRLRHNSTKKTRKGKTRVKSGSDPAAGDNKKEKLEQTSLVNASSDVLQSNTQVKALTDQNPIATDTTSGGDQQRGLEDTTKVPQREAGTASHADLAHHPTTELGLTHTDLEEDLFANLQAMPSDSDTHRDANGDGPLSPTAAYLMNFPLVAGGGKAAGNHLTEPCDDENDECSPGGQPTNTRTVEQENAKKSSDSYNDSTGNGVMADNYASFFNYNPMDVATGEAGSVPITTISSSSNTNRDSGGLTTNYATNYQSIDTMLEHRPVLPNLVGTTSQSETVPPDTSSTSSSATTFTFTLTSTTTSTPVTTQPHSTAANHFYTPSKASVVADGSTNCPVNRKPPPVTPIEFTFSLTTTTAAPPRTVQSQYTNSTILATTMTTPSYDTYGYYHKTPTKSSSYSSTFNAILDPLLTNCGNTNGDNISTEKPATSFTFCLTSTTKTQPSYTQSASSIATAQPTQIFSESNVPKVSVRQQQSVGGALSSHKMKDGTSVRSTNDNYESDFHLQQTQQHQSKYDVSWMAEGRQEYKSSDHVSIVTQSHTTSYNQYNHLQQHQPQSQQNQQQQQYSQQSQQQIGYEYTSQLINSSIDYAIPSATGYGANFELNHPHNQNPNRKSDIFFAHPVGDEGVATGLAGTWSSPSKLHDNSYFVPPVTLPVVSNGGIELNTSSASCKQASSSVRKAQQASAQQESTGSISGTGSSFLSVSQLVDQSNKVYSNNNASVQGNLPSSVSGTSCQQHKPPNNSYSAEALIGNTTYNTSNSASDSSEAVHGRKDKLYDYGCSGNAPIGELIANPSNAATIPFNFDGYTTPTTDYSKSYNFSNQFLDGGNGYGSLTTATPSGTATGSGLYYGKTTAASSQGSYFHPAAGNNFSSTGSNYHAIPAAPTVNGDGFPSYYLPSFTEKAVSSNHSTSGKHYTGVVPSEQQQHKSSERKSHKGSNVRPATDYVRSMASNSTTSSIPNSATSNSYSLTTSSQFPNNGTIVVSSAKTQPTESVSYPNYHQHQQHQQQQISQHEQQRTYRSIPADIVHSTQKPSHQGIEPTASYSYNQYSTSSTHSYEPSKVPSKRQSSVLPPDEGFNGIDSTSYIANQSHHLDVASCFNTSSSVPSSGGAIGYGATSAPQMPLYGSQVHHHQHPHHHHHHHQSGSSSLVQSSSGGTITNFNLSTICPEINDKTGRTAVDRGDAEPSVASIMTLW
ncbi:mucin-5AC-like [Anopheles darlingi]|uniref:mucin-5AC-like n=1 Tax=Anopheles darlingi TaxID=43151 RepID=UPI0021003AA8|nr:mucin-5AC-like [Anopheles darlingi]